MIVLKRSFKLLIMILLIPIILVGCFNYREINTVTFTTCAIFDIADNGEILLYLDCVKPYRNASESSDKGQRIIYKGTGKTALEAIRDINSASSYKVNFTQNRAIIFTEKAARKGIDKYLSLINTDQEFQVKPYVFVFFGNVEELIKISSSDEEYLGLFLNELVQKNKANPRSIVTNISDYLIESKVGNNYAVIGGLDIRKDVIDERVELSGGALMRRTEMVERIDRTEGMSYNFLMNRIKTGTLEAKNPQMKEGFLTLEILNSKTKTNIEYTGGEVILTKKIKINTVIAESQGRFIATKESIMEIKKNQEENIKEYLQQFFYRFSNKQIDVLQVERLLEMKYPKLQVEDILSKINLNIDVDIEITESNRVKDNYF
ncbi:Ger(x)C family spore germination protein [Clostridium sp. Ade.TY]|uniref:Ger(x)C family spore germination protein n=1 Tax=Clostridium sp. Ade.TY TaxID=1391647 RepID=UPI0004070F40|nr:Ger(x)C family spore germination protein [Clostridium sp. Ade.TY]